MFESRRILDEHYLTVHEEAFSDEELMTDKSGRSQFVETPKGSASSRITKN